MWNVPRTLQFRNGSHATMLLPIDPSRLHALYGKEARQEVSILQSKAECDEIFGVQWGLLHVDRFVQGMAAVLVAGDTTRDVGCSALMCVHRGSESPSLRTSLLEMTA